MSAADELWKQHEHTTGRVEAWVPVTRPELDDLVASAARDALMATARTVEHDLSSEYFNEDGKAEEWTTHKRKVWADGAATALGRIRRAAQYPEVPRG